MVVTFSAIIIAKDNEIHIASYHTCLHSQDIFSKKPFLELSQIFGAQLPLLEKIQNNALMSAV